MKYFLTILLIIPFYLSAQVKPNQWVYVRSDTIPAIMITKNSKTTTDTRQDVKLIYNIFTRGELNEWADFENNIQTWYKGIQTDKQLVKILIITSGITLPKEFDFSHKQCTFFDKTKLN